MSFELIKPGINIDFIGRRHLAYTFSVILMLICISAIFYKGGLKMGIDFAGGLLVQAKFSEEVNQDQIRVAVAEKSGLPLSSIQNFGGEGDREFLINLQLKGDEGETANREIQAQAVKALTDAFGSKVEIRRVEMVGPKVGETLRQNALYAIYYSLLMILIYISGRFEQKWGTSAAFVAALLGVVYVASLFNVGVFYLIILALGVTLTLCYFLRFEYALGAILALTHDVIVTVGIFAILDKEINLNFVAAALTIVGYSLNDSIIIYDRIREHVQKSRKINYAETINKSINETLSRTILTSGSTVLVLICLYALGAPATQDFALALLIGIAFGTFSSIFISAPVLLFWTKRDDGRLKDVPTATPAEAI